MGLLSGLLGLASDVDIASVVRDLEPALADGEEVEVVFAILRDLVVFTDLRVILVDKQGVSGRKRSFHSIPYRSITMFTVETAGSFDTDAEMTIFVSGQPQPIRREIARGANLVGIQKSLAAGVLGRK